MTPRKECLSDTRQVTYELTETVAACTRSAQVQAGRVPLLKGGNGHKLSSLTKKLPRSN